ncbi:hypothetical protein [Aliarcobacter butzleri]|uniref:hypothetical protein n=1 Tax=Aliarcobacter butzleri TaxID=28197 RepID=UPI00126A05CD|nr:hypothetical protein [Aliarcobacter butzleri]
MIKNIVLAGSVSLLLVGCTMKEEADRKFNKQADINIQDYEEKNYLIEKMRSKEIIGKNQYVNVDTKKSVETLLSNLSLIDGKFYHLQGLDIQVPSVKGYPNIKSFQDLNTYIQQTTNKALVIDSNKYLANGIKTVRIVDKNSLQNNFDDIKINLQGKNVDLKSAFLTVSKLTNFNIVYKNSQAGSKDSQNGTGAAISLGNSNGTSEFEAELISFNEGSVSSFLKTVEATLDLYIDIDYKEKMIVVSKYKTRNIPLIVNDRDVKKSKMATAASGAENLQSDTQQDIGGISSQFEFGVFKELQKSLDELTQNYNGRNSAKIDISTGSVNIYATNDVMRKITEKIETFNDSFRKSVEVELTTMELLVNNNWDYGSDLSGSKTDTSNGLIGAIESALTGENLPAITLTTKHGDTAKIKSLKDIGFVSKTTTQSYKARNHTPFVIQETNLTNYVENMTSTPIQTGDTTTVTQSTETSKIEVGLTAVVLPKIVGDEISLYINPASTKLDDLTKEKFSNLEINIPSINISVIENEPLLRDGDKIIIGSHSVYEDADSYKGLIPIDNFVIGGSQSKKLVKKVIVYILSAKTY